MKTKLLRKARRRFKMHWYPGRREYVITENGARILDEGKLQLALAMYSHVILNYCRKKYPKLGRKPIKKMNYGRQHNPKCTWVTYMETQNK